jgi:hypothetical protein
VDDETMDAELRRHVIGWTNYYWEQLPHDLMAVSGTVCGRARWFLGRFGETNQVGALGAVMEIKESGCIPWAGRKTKGGKELVETSERRALLTEAPTIGEARLLMRGS